MPKKLCTVASYTETHRRQRVLSHQTMHNDDIVSIKAERQVLPEKK